MLSCECGATSPLSQITSKTKCHSSPVPLAFRTSARLIAGWCVWIGVAKIMDAGAHSLSSLKEPDELVRCVSTGPAGHSVFWCREPLSSVCHCRVAWPLSFSLLFPAARQTFLPLRSQSFAFGKEPVCWSRVIPPS